MKSRALYSLLGVFIGTFNAVFCGFQHRVIPACDESDKVCRFDFDIDYKFSMVYYFNGFSTPIVVRNGTLMKRSVYNSEKFAPLTPQGEFFLFVSLPQVTHTHTSLLINLNMFLDTRLVSPFKILANEQYRSRVYILRVRHRLLIASGMYIKAFQSLYV